MLEDTNFLGESKSESESKLERLYWQWRIPPFPNPNVKIWVSIPINCNFDKRENFHVYLQMPGMVSVIASLEQITSTCSLKFTADSIINLPRSICI